MLSLPSCCCVAISGFQARFTYMLQLQCAIQSKSLVLLLLQSMHISLALVGVEWYTCPHMYHNLEISLVF